MSLDRFNDDCPGCRPALTNARTGERLPVDSPEMRAVNRVWSTTTRAEREAFHRVTCMRSAAEADVALFFDLAERVKRAVSALQS